MPPKNRSSSLSSFMAKSSYVQKPLLLAFLLLALIFIYRSQLQNFFPASEPEKPGAASTAPDQKTEDKNAKPQPLIPLRRKKMDAVVAKMLYEDVSWIRNFCKEYGCTPNIYTTEEVPEDGYLVPRTPIGHEASAYLTFIVDNYDNLAPYTFFLHGHADHWHNDAGGPKTMDQLRNFRLEAVDAYGYVNLRCTLRPGCPDFLHPEVIQASDIKNQYLVDNFANIYGAVFGVTPAEAPKQVGTHCCAQFAVSRDRIRSRPRRDYERILNWIVNSPMTTDSYGVGWMLEKVWHILFGMEAVHCPDLQQCRCDLYGWCGPHRGTGHKILTPVLPPPNE